MAAIKELLLHATQKLKDKSDTARLDAELLLSFASGLSRTQLISKAGDELPPEVVEQFEGLLSRRKNHESVALITGEKEFYGLKFRVTPDVLTPRPETELLVETALKELQGSGHDLRILDLGTGSGCIAVAVAKELLKTGRRFEIIAVDRSEAALEIARSNINLHECESCITLLQSDWFSAPQLSANKYDLIVCNPPYIATGDSNVSPETKNEPASALYADADGLHDLKYLLNQAPKFLKNEGVFLSEIGADQLQSLRDIHAASPYSGLKLESLKDLGGRDRLIVIRS